MEVSGQGFSIFLVTAITLLCELDLGEVLQGGFLWFCFCKVVIPISYNAFGVKDLRLIKPTTCLIFIFCY